MKFFDAGQHALGFIAIGQEATGFIAIGQGATGVIAIGQLARGVFAVGQLAFGFVGWGQLGGGIFHAAGMVGTGGRRGVGLIVPLVPSLGRQRTPPPTIPLAAVLSGQAGWVALDLAGARDLQGLGLYQGGRRLPIKLDRRLQSGAHALTQDGPCPVFAFTKRVGAVVVCERIAHVPAPLYRKRGWWQLGALQFAGLLGLGIAYWGVVGNDLVAGLGKVFADNDGKPAVVAPRGRVR